MFICLDHVTAGTADQCPRCAAAPSVSSAPTAVTPKGVPYRECPKCGKGSFFVNGRWVHTFTADENACDTESTDSPKPMPVWQCQAHEAPHVPHDFQMAGAWYACPGWPGPSAVQDDDYNPSDNPERVTVRHVGATGGGDSWNVCDGGKPVLGIVDYPDGERVFGTWAKDGEWQLLGTLDEWRRWRPERYEHD